MRHLLILGGTAEARALAAAVDGNTQWHVTSSLAGRVSRPRMPVGAVRTGGFGGPRGLADFLQHNEIDAVVDATHPFATTMTSHAAAASAATGVSLLRFARPGWSEHPLAATWWWTSTYDEAARVADSLGRRPFLTTGRQTLGHFLHWTDRDVLVRVVEPLDSPAPQRWSVIHDRGPFEQPAERKLLQDNRIDVLLTKDSGGCYTESKLQAAAALGVAVVVVRRPSAPSATHEVSDVGSALDWLRALPPR